jgi:prepilin-type N-terminal cleavage/methylation domain-containing protein
MKKSRNSRRDRGLTLVELLVVIVVLAIFWAYIFSGAEFANAKPRALRIQCVNNLQEIGLAERIWAGDHGHKYSFQVAETNGGTMSFITGPNAWRHFQIMSNELSTPKFLLCPADDLRTVAATNFNFLSNSNLSYFVGLDSTEDDPQGLFSGDCNITNGTPIKNGILELTTNRPAGWTGGTHVKVGNVALSDGSVQQLSITGLRQGVANSGAFTNHLQMPVIP